MRFLSLIFIILFLLFCQLIAQDTTQTSPSYQDAGIKITASIATKEIPLNRILKFTIHVEWFGDLSRYEISEVENPSLRNFKIQSNSSSDRREMVAGNLKAIKTFEFDLIPEELGMGYIEGVIVKYIDTESGEGKHLITNRLEVKVIDPIPEPGSHNMLYRIIFLSILLIAFGSALLLWLRKRAEQKRLQAEAIPPPPIEQDYLRELKNSVKLDAPDLNIKDAFSTTSLMLRRYLTAKYNFGATNAITEEIINTLKQNEVNDSLIHNVEEVLNTCDVVKFSGGVGEKSSLDRMVTLMEDFLNQNLKSAFEPKEKPDDSN